MSYYHSRTTTLPFDEAVARVREALKAEQFGVITSVTSIQISEDFRVSYFSVFGLKYEKEMLEIGYFPLNCGTMV